MSGDRYTGVAGERLVESEFFDRGWNVGAPAVDRGDDLFALRDFGARIARLQVKTAHAKSREYGFSAKYTVTDDQVEMPVQPPLHLIFTTRIDDDWGPILVFSRSELYDLVANEQMGTDSDYSYTFYIRFHRDDAGGIAKVLCSDSELTEYVDDFSRWE